ncbi:DUF1850 domain-containing protein [Treponema vincentii]|uniref:DUF1850 domain-containing protein n=1 Tax=Treponema vincentii TaxID=69710 RepID=UPI0020A50359|nr:DUF1850 domain-containing protein [Treponema vincentii]UTC48277.1 DUF1850 domain-containing protein [Treponema vincentii]
MERLFIEVRRMRAVLCRYMMYMLIAASLLHTSCSSAETIEISNQITKEAYLSHIVKAGDILSFEWEHSFEHVLWKEFYRVTDEHTFKLFTIAVQGFGAGIPAEMDCTYRYEDGFIYMENIEGSVFKEFNWIHSQTQLKQIILNDTVLIWGTELPQRAKIRLALQRSTSWLQKIP